MQVPGRHDEYAVLQAHNGLLPVIMSPSEGMSMVIVRQETSLSLNALIRTRLHYRPPAALHVALVPIDGRRPGTQSAYLHRTNATAR